MLQAFPISDLEAYLDEALPPEEMARIEKAARKDRGLVGQLASIHARRGAGVHSLGEIWRRHQLSCPSREELGNYVLGALAAAEAGYVAFHVGSGRLPLLPGQPHRPRTAAGRDGAGRPRPPPQVLPVQRRLSAEGQLKHCKRLQP